MRWEYSCPSSLGVPGFPGEDDDVGRLWNLIVSVPDHCTFYVYFGVTDAPFFSFVIFSYRHG